MQSGWGCREEVLQNRSVLCSCGRGGEGWDCRWRRCVWSCCYRGAGQRWRLDLGSGGLGKLDAACSWSLFRLKVALRAGECARWSWLQLPGGWPQGLQPPAAGQPSSPRRLADAEHLDGTFNFHRILGSWILNNLALGIALGLPAKQNGARQRWRWWQFCASSRAGAAHRLRAGKASPRSAPCA